MENRNEKVAMEAAMWAAECEHSEKQRCDFQAGWHARLAQKLDPNVDMDERFPTRAYLAGKRAASGYWEALVREP